VDSGCLSFCPLGVGDITGFMNTSSQKIIAKTVALILVSMVVTLLIERYNLRQLAKLDANPNDYLEHKRHVLQSPGLALFILMLVQGAVFIGTVEFISYGIRSFLSKKSDA
jgi:hypothetical protein